MLVETLFPRGGRHTVNHFKEPQGRPEMKSNVLIVKLIIFGWLLILCSVGGILHITIIFITLLSYTIRHPITAIAGSLHIWRGSGYTGCS
jgi:hypothetical protein